jgi:hypothetical protein
VTPARWSMTGRSEEVAGVVPRFPSGPAHDRAAPRPCAPSQNRGRNRGAPSCSVAANSARAAWARVTRGPPSGIGGPGGRREGSAGTVEKSRMSGDDLVELLRVLGEQQRAEDVTTRAAAAQDRPGRGGAVGARRPAGPDRGRAHRSPDGGRRAGPRCGAGGACREVGRAGSCRHEGNGTPPVEALAGAPARPGLPPARDRAAGACGQAGLLGVRLDDLRSLLEGRAGISRPALDRVRRVGG